MFAAVVLAGGAALRLGGTAKPSRTVGGITLLTRVLAAVADAEPRIVVGPPDLALPPGVRRTLEQPAGGGPVAAIAAGLRLLPPEVPLPGGQPDLVAVLAADLPFLTTRALDRLRAAARTPGRDAAVLIDTGGRPQWLCAVWRIDALRDRLADLGDPTGASMRRLTATASVADIEQATVPDRPPAWFDCDTEEDLRRAEEWADGEHS